MTIQNINFAKYAGKTDGSSTLTANEWNTIMSELDTVVDAIPESSSQPAGGSDSGIVSAEIDPLDADKTIVKVNDVTVGELTVKGTKGTNVALSGNNNINIEPRPAIGTGKGKNNTNDENRKGGNISLKPGDDIELCSHKRGTGKNTEVAVKVIDGSDNPVKLQVFAGDITLSTKGKGSTKKKDATTGADTQELLYDDPNVMNVNVTTGTGKGYLKVRAQAIDLRCEEHGGIALQPKGADNTGTTLNTIVAGEYNSDEAAVGYYFDVTHGVDFNSADLYQIIDPNNRFGARTAKLSFRDAFFHLTDIAEKDITLPYTLTSEEVTALNQGGYKLFVYITEEGVIQDVPDNIYIVKVTRKENKIKFEHGGGDGLEFGTFNSQRTSIFTDEYRFNQNGTILLSSRIKEQSDKADPDDDTTTYKYQKQADDFYDIIGGRRDVTWRDVVNIIGELKDMKRNNQGPWANA